MTKPSTADRLIQATGLCKAYGGRPVVVDVGLQLHRGEILGFVGPNGAGKTTTLRILAGLIAPDAGAADILGRDLSKLGRGDAQIGYMAQKLALYDDLTVTANLRFRADMYQLPQPAAQVHRVLETFGLHERRLQRARDLSGGWARRLQLAAALIHDPAVVLLDEPTAGLDSQSRQDVWDRIRVLADRGAGVIVNTHDLVEAERCSTVALFRLGRIVLRGAPGDLEVAAPIRAALVEAPVGWAPEIGGAWADGLLAIEPHGRRHRILARARQFDGIAAHIRAQGGMVLPDETRLSDIALLNERDAALCELAA